MARWNFAPISTQIISGATTSSSVTFTGALGLLRQVRIYNAGSSTIFVRFGQVSATAVVTDMAIPSGAIEVFDLVMNDTVAAITASSTATVYVTLGLGVG